MNMESMKQFSKRVLKEESAQGATEYILLLVAVVAVVVLFKDRIKTQIDQLIGRLEGQIGDF
jgi:Flp pilus assembly pilin Flp